MTEKTPSNWYIAQYTPVAWIETIVKLVALSIAIVTLINRLPSAEFDIPEGRGLIQFIVLVLLSLGLVAAIFDRIIERELIAMGFVIINNIGHGAMLIALTTMPHPKTELLIFAGLMLLGDGIKFYWLYHTQFRVRDTPMIVMYGLTLFFVIGYALLLGLEFAK